MSFSTSGVYCITLYVRAEAVFAATRAHPLPWPLGLLREAKSETVAR